VPGPFETPSPATEPTSSPRPAEEPSAIRKFLQSRGSSAIADGGFRWLMLLCAISIFAIVALIAGELVYRSQLTISKFGIKFFFGSAWDPVNNNFGALPFIYGTLVSSIIALIIAVPLAVGVAVFITEMCPRMLRGFLSFLTELLAAIPSVVYGLWGIFVIIPLVRPPADWLHSHLGWIPFFSTTLSGPGMLPAALVLAIMVLPTISAISRDALVAVPPKMVQRTRSTNRCPRQTRHSTFAGSSSRNAIDASIRCGGGRGRGSALG